MKLKIMIVLMAVVAAWMIGRQTKGGDNIEVAMLSSGQDEIRRTFKLAPNAQVELKGINGTIEIETSDSEDAELHIVRTAADRADLSREQIIVEQSSTNLNIYGQKGEGGWWERFGGGRVRNQVKLKLPRRVELTTRGINGPVKIGEVDGALHLSGINGRVDVAQSKGFTEASGINGAVSLAVARLADEGLKVRGINGRVEISLANDVNADVHVKGLNGSVSVDVPNVTEQERTRSSLQARIGAGGAPISVSGVNGGVHFKSSAPTDGR